MTNQLNWTNKYKNNVQPQTQGFALRQENSGVPTFIKQLDQELEAKRVHEVNVLHRFVKHNNNITSIAIAIEIIAFVMFAISFAVDFNSKLGTILTFTGVILGAVGIPALFALDSNPKFFKKL